MIKLTKPPRWIDGIYSSFTWRFFVSEPVIYLTFDDGPDPEITPFVLDLLKEYDWKATFFCVGENIKKEPELTQRILSDGHRIGNHTMRHENGRKTSLTDYIDSVNEFNQTHQTTLFRPPYGSITRKQRQIVSKSYQIVLWSWLTYDFDLGMSNESILRKTKTLKNGEIVVLHDNAKFKERNQILLPELFQKIKAMGFKSEAIIVK